MLINKWPLYPGLKISHWNHPQKNSVSELGVIFWGSPLFLAVLGLCHDRGATTLNFSPISTKLGGTVRAIKKMTQNDKGPSPDRNYGEMAVFTFSREWFFGRKCILNQKNTQNFLRDLKVSWLRSMVFLAKEGWTGEAEEKVTQQQVWKSNWQPLRTTSSLEKISWQSPSIQTKVKKLPFLGVFLKLFVENFHFRRLYKPVLPCFLASWQIFTLEERQPTSLFESTCVICEIFSNIQL